MTPAETMRASFLATWAAKPLVLVFEDDTPTVARTVVQVSTGPVSRWPFSRDPD